LKKKKKEKKLCYPPPSRQIAGMKRENANLYTISVKLSNQEYILILKQLFIDRSFRQKIPEGTSSAMFVVRTIAKCCELASFDILKFSLVARPRGHK